ncbi:hypothetical protein APHAL10511_000655 [Amanita phalloides]|nr:hypothetical protein APHAL10511_000655 [Amanita phalloides]
MYLNDFKNSTLTCVDTESTDVYWVVRPVHFSHNVYFEVGCTLFKFPKDYLANSNIFSRLLNQELLKKEAEEVGISGDGSLENPFECTKINRQVLESFLSFMRTRIFCSGRALIEKKSWIDILEISYLWQMVDVHKLVLRRLNKIGLDAIEKLEVVKRYGIKEKDWSLPPIRELVRAGKRLGAADAQRIGIDMALRISRVQGMVLEHPIMMATDHYFGSKEISLLDVYILREFPNLF